MPNEKDPCEIKDCLEKLHANLMNLGLSSYEARAYAAMAVLKEATASEIASHSDVPKGRIYDVLNDLSARGLVHLTLVEGKSNLYTSVEPDVVVEHLSQQLKDKIELSRSSSLAMLDELRACEAEEKEPRLPVRLVSGPLAINLGMESLIRQSAQYVRIMLSQQRYHHLLPAVEEALSRDVRFVALHETEEERRLLSFFGIESRQINYTSRLVSRIAGDLNASGRTEILIVDDCKACLLFPWDGLQGMSSVSLGWYAVRDPNGAPDVNLLSFQSLRFDMDW